MLRFYRWDQATVSFGRNEPAAEAYSSLRGSGHAFVRRPTGGRAVLHDQELTYAVIFPSRSLGGVRDAYRRINEGLLAGLRLMGVSEASMEVGPGGALSPDAGPCFGSPAPGEVVFKGRKLVGSAQARIDGSILQHGSLLLVSDQGDLHGEGDGGEAVTLEEILGEIPKWDSLVEALRRGVEGVLPGKAWEQSVYRGEEAATAGELEDRYRDEAWTWRK